MKAVAVRVMPRFSRCSKNRQVQIRFNMEFRMAIRPEAGMRGLVRHGETVMLVGSCFSDNIGGCLRDELFEADVNPFGPIYNPLSIRNAFKALAGGHRVSRESLIENGGLWHSFMFHSRYSAVNPAEAVAKMNLRLEESAENLRRASVVIITLGTTRVFTLREGGEAVANCHKLSGRSFDVRYLSLEETAVALNETVATIRSVNPMANVIFTVSPLRYSEQGAHGNQDRKSVV